MLPVSVMIFTMTDTTYREEWRTARLASGSGARPPVGNQAGVEKSITGQRPPVVDQAGVEKYATGKNPVKFTGNNWKRQICPFFLNRSCKFGTKCRNPHSKGDCIRKSKRKTGYSWKWQICRHFLRNSCKFGIRCRKPHSRGGCVDSHISVTKSTKCDSESEFTLVSYRDSKIKDKVLNASKHCPRSNITLKNRFGQLQQTEVGQDKLPINKGRIYSPTSNTLARGRTNISGKSKGSSCKKSRDQNPSGDIWDQKSLNLDTLFGLSVVEDLKIGIWNAESVRQKENLIKDYMLENDLDALVTLESWLELNELPSTEDIIPCKEAYKLHQLPRPGRKNASGGGMLCIYKRHLAVVQIPAIKTKVLEVMDLKISVQNKSIRLVSVYRPPKTKNRTYPVVDFYEDMENLVSHYKTVKDEVIFCGDYNVHINKPEESETRKFNNIVESANLKQYVSGKTHTKGNTLDLVMTENNSAIIKNCVVDEFLSDHAMIVVDLDLRKPPKSKKLIRFRKNKDVDLEKLNAEIEENLSGIGNTDNLSELVDKFNQALSDAYDKQAPLRAKTIIIRPPTPWSYDDIKEDKATRRRLERRWRRTGLQVDWEIYRDFRNKFNAKLNHFRQKQYSDMIEKNKDDPTTLFRVINKSLHRKQPSPLPSGLTNAQLAEKFSNFFAEKIEKIRGNIDVLQTDPVNDAPIIQNIDTNVDLSEFKQLTENEVEKMVMEFPNKQCELDPLPLAMLKECLPVVLPHITKIVNLSLRLGDLPDKLKMAIIRPLLKKLGLETELKNYRPVSNLCFLSKLIEKIVAKQFVDHLVKHKLMDPLQSAYKKYHSTETALVKVQNDILIDIDNKNVSLLVLLDLSAAFDTIDHGILMKRLENNYGIKGTALKWFRSFITNRSQSVVIDDEISAAKTLKYGVPQGSVLGPLLFTAYMTPLKEVISKHGLKYHCYADDTQLYISFSPRSVEEEEKAIDSLEKAIKDIKTFMISNKLKLNDDKTEVIFLGTRVRLDQIESTELTIGDSVIKPAEMVKNLGVMFDKNLSMDNQVKSVCKAGFYHIKNLWRIRKFLNVEEANVAAHAFVTSKLDYGNALLGGAPKYQVKKLQTVQNAAARVVTKTGKFDHISDKMRNLEWLPVGYRIKYKINLLTWKALNNMSPEYISDMISEREEGKDLRSGKTKVLNVPKSNLKTMGDKAFSVVAPKSWNLLPTKLRLNENLRSFKAGLKSLYLEDAYSSLD